MEGQSKNVIVNFMASAQGVRQVAKEFELLRALKKDIAKKMNVSVPSLNKAMAGNNLSQELSSRAQISAAIKKSEMERAKEAQMIDQVALKASTAVFKQANAMTMLEQKNATVSSLMKQTGLSAEKLAAGMSRAGFTISKTGKVLNKFGQEVKLTDKQLKDIVKSSKRFNMSLLSVMFAGMALQRVANKMLRSVITTFQKANEDTQGLGKSTWQLQAAWEFFKYSLVDALTQSPLFQTLIQYLVKFVQWLNKLPEGAKSMLLIGIIILWVLGTLMLIIGQVGLFINGLSAMGLIGTAASATLVAAFWWVLAIIIIVIALWQTNLGGFRDFVKNTLGIIFLTFKTIFTSIWKLVTLVFKWIKAIFKGDFDEANRIAIQFLKTLLALFLKAFLGLGAIMINIWKWIWNVILDSLQFSLNLAVNMLNSLIRAINKIPGISIPLIPKVNLQGLKAAYMTMADVQKQFDVVDKKLGITASIDNAVASASSGSKNVTDNSQYVDNKSYNFTGIGEEKVRELLEESNQKQIDQLNRKNDSTL